MKIKKNFFLALFAMGINASFAQPKGLSVGDIAPDFKATSQDGSLISLKKELKNGPVVLFFYRGSWCPYCNKQMAQLQDSLKFIKAKGASIIGVTPETNESMKKILKNSAASFPLISDTGTEIMNLYDVSFKLDAPTVERYKKYNIDLTAANGNSENKLPVPATYIIGVDGKIKFVYFNTDYKMRASVAEIISHL